MCEVTGQSSHVARASLVGANLKLSLSLSSASIFRNSVNHNQFKLKVDRLIRGIRFIKL